MLAIILVVCVERNSSSYSSNNEFIRYVVILVNEARVNRFAATKVRKKEIWRFKNDLNRINFYLFIEEGSHVTNC